MNDLLGTVRDDYGKRGRSSGGGNPLYGGDEEEGFEAPPNEQELAMRQFFKAVEEIKTDMAEIRGLQREVNQMHEKSKTIVKSKEMQRHREEMQVSRAPFSMLACELCMGIGT